jgi:hypothetical protein
MQDEIGGRRQNIQIREIAITMMALSLKFVALLGISVASNSEILSPPAAEKLFADFMVYFDKSYENEAEASARMQIFMENNGKTLLFAFLNMQV